jgi:hypothetical protein
MSIANDGVVLTMISSEELMSTIARQHRYNIEQHLDEVTKKINYVT